MKVKVYQQGGPMEGAQTAEAPAQGGQDAAMQQLAQIAEQIINELGPEGAMALAQMIMEMVQGAEQQGEPIFKRGGKIVKKAKKAACGSKMK